VKTSKPLWKGVFGSIRRVPKPRAIGHRGLGQPVAALFVRRGGRAESATAQRLALARAKAGGVKIGGRKLGLELRQKSANGLPKARYATPLQQPKAAHPTFRLSDQIRPMRRSTRRTIRMMPMTPMPP